MLVLRGSGWHAGEVIEEALTEPGIIDRARPVSTPGIDLALVREFRCTVDALQAAPDGPCRAIFTARRLADGLTTFLR